MHSLVVWGTHDTGLVLSCAFALLVIILAISVAKLPPFLGILIGALVFSATIGLAPARALTAFQAGAGKLLGDSGLIIALGALLGSMVAGSGAAARLVHALLNPGGRPLPVWLLPWCVAAAAMLVGLPLFFEVGLVIMLPLILGIARSARQPVLRVAIPALAGMTALHALVPPHPGPLIAISALHASLGTTLLLGLLIAVPAVILAGPLYGNLLPRYEAYRTIGERNSLSPPNTPNAPHRAAEAASAGQINPDTTGPSAALHSGSAAHSTRAKRQDTLPPLSAAAITILLPVLLMLARTISELCLPQTTVAAHVLDTIGEPFMALLISVIFAVIVLGWVRRQPRAEIGRTLHDSLPPLAVLLLTIGAGGGLKQVLLSAGIADTISKVAVFSPFPFVVLAWLVAVCLRQATGSATVATSTTAGLMAPLLGGMAFSPSQTSLIALSIGSGSVFFCHVNDAGFWMVHELFGLTLKQTVMVWSVLQTIVSVTGIVLCCVLWPMMGH
ncbi:GntP family permease [Acetobacter indonesiensis]|uniref:GntP family permease n=1 Tax=Acetobacter indonesiensis TaxID=104101 RepID=UPI0020A2F0FA|nr:SLC13 family permease [Acetobacter indonesiensis]MCP1231516.1 GntP family permease [Acetobacter indonesiensis]